MNKKAFTLIELLIVVAIIAILAAIAVPNFLEAQVRSKVARTRADLRTIGLAMESYAIDWNGKYSPLPGNLVSTKNPTTQINRGPISTAFPLSTPVAYLSTTIQVDQFCPDKYWDSLGYTSLEANAPNAFLQSVYTYVNVKMMEGAAYSGERPAWWVVSLGPDYYPGPDARNGNYWTPTNYRGKDPYGQQWAAWAYDPSNGTISGGDIWRHQ